MSKLIVALDFAQPQQALSLVEQLKPSQCALKIGSELFTRSGPDIVTQIIKQGFRVFLDLKFHDIPHTVAQACKAAADMGVWMLTLHASGGPEMMRAAREAVASYGVTRPKIVAVTILTSMTQTTLNRLGITNALLPQVLHLAKMAKEAGVDGVVSSAQEVSHLRQVCGDNFVLVTPGIRLPGDDAHDQARVISPEAAIQAGSDYLVMGRSITQAKDACAVIKTLQYL